MFVLHIFVYVSAFRKHASLPMQKKKEKYLICIYSEKYPLAGIIPIESIENEPKKIIKEQKRMMTSFDLMVRVTKILLRAGAFTIL